MRWIVTKNPHLDKILAWIEYNILDRIFHKRILKKLTASMKSGFVDESTDTNFKFDTTTTGDYIITWHEWEDE